MTVPTVPDPRLAHGHAPVPDPVQAGRVWPVVRCAATGCPWDSRGHVDGSERCLGVATAGCRATELGDLDTEARHLRVMMLAGSQGARRR